MTTSNESILPSPFDDGENYDLLLGDLDYGVEYYLAEARATPGPILDLACGTGRILLALLKAGLDAEGVDLASDMLKVLNRKADRLGLQPRVTQSSMTSFRLDRQFGLITCACNSFNHNLTKEDQLATLRACREHLLPGGMLTFDSFFPSSSIIMAPQNTRVLELEIRDPNTGQSLRNYDTRSFDRVQQQQHSINELEFLDDAGQVVSNYRTETTVRWIYRFEMELLLEVAGYSRWEIFGGFDRRPLINENDAMIVRAWK